MEAVYFENNYGKVYFNTSLDAVFLEYKAKVPSHKDFLELNLKIIDCFTSLQTPKLVADIRKMGILGLESQQWIVEILLPTLIKHLKGKPLIHAQLMDEKEIMAKVSANNVKQKSAKAIENFQLQQFHKMEDVEKFLREN